jgi:hypothetical protein
LYAKFDDNLRAKRQIPEEWQQMFAAAIAVEAKQRKVLDNFPVELRRALCGAGLMILIGAFGFVLAQAMPDLIQLRSARGRPTHGKPRHKFAAAAALEMLIAARWLYGAGGEPIRPISILVSEIAEEQFSPSSVRQLRKNLNS